MSQTQKSNHNKLQGQFFEKIEKKMKRKLKSRAEADRRGLWYGLGMFGLVGWAVSIPTLIFLGLGIWLDSQFESQYSWTLMFLAIGIVLGCLNAWYWIKRESRDE